jgi:DNA-directed RNA polymerase specialized sigma24 family protein
MTAADDEHLLELYCYLMAGDRESGRDLFESTLLMAWRERALGTPQTMSRMWLYAAATRAYLERGA